MRALPGALDAFYAHLKKFPETEAFFKNPDVMVRAKEGQVRHWSVLLNGRFDDEYLSSIDKIGQSHHKIGLDPKWHIGGYSVLISNLTDALADRPASQGSAAISYRGASKAATERKALLEVAIFKVAMLDVELIPLVTIPANVAIPATFKLPVSPV